MSCDHFIMEATIRHPLYVSILMAFGLLTLAPVTKSQSPNQQVNSVGKVMPFDAAPPAEQTLTVMFPEPKSLDVSIFPYDDTGNLLPFEPLLWRDENLQPVAGAAEQYEASPDLRTWTFNLRPGARWSDGRPVTAHDFVYTYRRMLDPASTNAYAFFFYDIKNAEAISKGHMEDVKRLGVHALDDLTFVIETEHPAPYLPYVVSFGGAAPPVPRWAVEKYGRKWTQAEYIVSNSGFKLAEWVTASHMTFVADPYYNGPHRPYLEKIIHPFRESAAINILPYENNEVDMEGVDVTEIDRIMRDPLLSRDLVRFPSQVTWYFLFRTRQTPFNDIRVREAFARAIDREVLCQKILRGAGVPAYGMLTPEFEAYNGNQHRMAQGFDPERAAGLMRAAGYPRGRGFPPQELWLRSPSPTIRRLAVAMQGMFKEHLGVDVNLQSSADEASYMGRLYDWQINLGFIPWAADFQHPRNMLDTIWHSQPRGAQRQDWTNLDFDRLVDQALGELNPATRLRLYQRAEEVLINDYGGAFVFHQIGLALRKPWVKGYPRHADGTVGLALDYTKLYISRK